MKTVKYVSMAALFVMGAVVASCTKQIENAPEAVQPLVGDNIEVYKTTINAAETKALTAAGVKTFAEGETMAVIYNNGTATVKAVSHELTSGDLFDGGRYATFTFDLVTPDKNVDVTYIYPAAMANSDGTVNYDALDTQDGTLSTLASHLDLCTYTHSWNGESLPAGTLSNELAICAFTLKNNAGDAIITGGLNQVTVGDGTNTYTVAPASGTFDADIIYVAMRPVTTDASLTLTATAPVLTVNDDAKNYTKSTTSRTYAAGNFYSIPLRMTPVYDGEVNINYHSGDLTVPAGKHYLLSGSTYAKKISLANGAVATLDGLSVDCYLSDNRQNYHWAGITCEGDATIILKNGSTNTVMGFNDDYPGIQIPSGYTLTIQGKGTLNARPNTYDTAGTGAGIGGGYNINCGNIVIKDGIINATGGSCCAGIGGGDKTCGNITITGGTVTATGGSYAPGIGGAGYDGSCGTITITNTVTSVTSRKGGVTYGPYCLGKGYGTKSSCGTITIGGTVRNQSDFTGTSFTYQP